MNTQQEGFGSGMATGGRAWWRKGNFLTQPGKPSPGPPPLALHPWSPVIFSNGQVLLNPNQETADLSCLGKQAQGTVYSLTSNESPEALLEVMVWTHPPAGEMGGCSCCLAGCTVLGTREHWVWGGGGDDLLCWVCRRAGCCTAGSISVCARPVFTIAQVATRLQPLCTGVPVGWSA